MKLTTPKLRIIVFLIGLSVICIGTFSLLGYSFNKTQMVALEIDDSHGEILDGAAIEIPATR